MKTVKNLIWILAVITLMMACGKGNSSKHENEREIEVSALPKTVKDGIQRDFPGAKLLEADEVTQPDNSLTYDIEIETDHRLEVMYDARGKYLGTEEEGEDDDEEEEDEDDDDGH